MKLCPTLKAQDKINKMQHIGFVLGKIKPAAQGCQDNNPPENPRNQPQNTACLCVLHHNLFIFYALYGAILAFARFLFGAWAKGR